MCTGCGTYSVCPRYWDVYCTLGVVQCVPGTGYTGCTGTVWYCGTVWYGVVQCGPGTWYIGCGTVCVPGTGPCTLHWVRYSVCPRYWPVYCTLGAVQYVSQVLGCVLYTGCGIVCSRYWHVYCTVGTIQYVSQVLGYALYTGKLGVIQSVSQVLGWVL